MDKRIDLAPVDKPKPSKIPRLVRGGGATARYGGGTGKNSVMEPFGPQLSVPKPPALDATNSTGSDRSKTIQIPQRSIDTMEALRDMDLGEWVEGARQLGVYDGSTRARGKALKEMCRRNLEFLPANGVLTIPDAHETVDELYARVMTPARKALVERSLARVRNSEDPNVQRRLAEAREKVRRDYESMDEGKGRTDD